MPARWDCGEAGGAKYVVFANIVRKIDQAGESVYQLVWVCTCQKVPGVIDCIHVKAVKESEKRAIELFEAMLVEFKPEKVVERVFIREKPNDTEILAAMERIGFKTSKQQSSAVAVTSVKVSRAIQLEGGE